MRALFALATLIASLVPAIHGGGPRHRLSLAADEQMLKAATAIVNHHGNALGWLRRWPSVRDAEEGADHQTITIHLRDGLTEAILPRALKTTALSSPAAGGTISASDFHSESAARAGGGAPALVLAPFAWEYGSFATSDGVAGLLTADGFATTELTNQAVTVDVMKNLANYKVVYMSGHAGWLSDGTVAISTGQPAPLNGGPYISDIMHGNMILGSVAGGDGTTVYYDITAGFVKTYVGTFMPGSLVVVNGCGSLYAANFGQAIQERGAATYVGWTNEVVSLDMEHGGYALMQNMTQGKMTAGRAVQSAIASGVGTSVYDPQHPASMGLLGDSSLSLDSSMPSTPTALPTIAVPTAGPTGPRAKKAHKQLQLLVSASPNRVRVGRTTVVQVKILAHPVLPKLTVTLNGRSTLAGYRHRQANGVGIAYFRVHPRRAGVIVGWISQSGSKVGKFTILAVK